MKLAQLTKSFGAKVKIANGEVEKIIAQMKDLGAREFGLRVTTKREYRFFIEAPARDGDLVCLYFDPGIHKCENTDLLWCWGKHNREFDLRITVVPGEDFLQDIKAMYLYRLSIEAFSLFYPKIDGQRELHLRLEKPFILKDLFEKATVSLSAIKSVLKDPELLHFARILARMEDSGNEAYELLGRLEKQYSLDEVKRIRVSDIFREPLMQILRANARISEATQDFVMMGRDEVFI